MTRAAKSQDQDDLRYLRQALMLARRGWGSSAPNPSVGAVIVTGAGARAEVVGRGWTQAGGRPHGETEALRRAGNRAQGATLYVTLEPCAHQGRTPPCTDAIIAAGISRVVVGTGDPDARVAGRGIARLRAAGIEVTEGVLAGEARWTAAGHILRVKEGRPFVQLKLAVSADGKIAPGTGKPVWVTGSPARARAHLLRAGADAILVGRGTVEADDPRLDCRLPGLAVCSPDRVILDGQLKTPVSAAILSDAARIPVWFMVSSAADAERRAALEALGARILETKSIAGRLQIEAVLALLADAGITRLLVEGGPQVAKSFIDAGLVDEAVIFAGPGVLGEAGISPLVDRGTEIFEDGVLWRRTASGALPGGDTMTVYQCRASLHKL